MKYTIQDIAQEFSKGNAEAVSDYFAQDITWTTAGYKTVNGREAVLELCRQPGAEAYLPFENKLIISDGNTIAVTGNSLNGSSSYCDVYVFRDGKIREINSYFVKTHESKPSQINVYLTFNGNCREAMTFYKECLGGELTFQAIGDSPMADRMPEEMKQCILHSTLKRDKLVLMASDMAGDQGLTKGNAVSLMLDCSSEEEIRSCYDKLSAGGQATHRLENTFWGALFGDLTDKYGNQWLLHFSKENINSSNK